MVAASQKRVDGRVFMREVNLFLMSSQAPRLRTLREFAEQEVVIPDGPFKGFKFSCERQPHTALWFDEIDSGKWRRHVLTGPVQSGKSLIGFIIIAMFHLFEHRETVILGLPSMEMASDKWKVDIEPVIRASRYRDLIPTTGAGSRGGEFESIQFKNGAVLKFMSGGGGDKKRSAFTSRVLIVTETDGLDEAGDNSREADPLRQLEARTASFGDKARIYLECTVSFEQGRTWQELKNGSDTKIALRCPHCGGWTTPERESLVGWQGAEDEMTAYERSAFYCDLCGAMWKEDERRTAHKHAKLVHKGQEITQEGEIVGDRPRTFTLGYRYTAANNFFRSAGEIGAAEWRATKGDNEETADRELCQFVWAKPPKPSVEALVSLDARALASRMQHPSRGFLPSDCGMVTVGVDIGKWLVHWSAIAWRSQGRGQVIDYGVVETNAKQLGEDVGIISALTQLEDTWSNGWKRGEDIVPAKAVFIDSGYRADLIYEFCKRSTDLTFPTKGFGTTEYSRPHGVGRTTLTIGEGYHVERLSGTGGVRLVEINADHFKSRLHEGYQCGPQGAGAITLFHSADEKEHFEFCKHQTAERKESSFDPRKGEVIKWVKLRKSNHWFDTTVLAMVAGTHCGVTINESEPEPPIASGGWFAMQRKR